MERSGTDRIRLGMVGGGQGAFIGGVHRIASRIDDRFELVAGALSSDAGRAAASAEALGLARSYDGFEEMATAEAARADGIEAVSIVAPNAVHAPAAMAFLKAGIHVICDKPLTSTLADAKALAAMETADGPLFVLTHNYTGYPMVRQAREMVAAGEIGEVRVVQVEYPQDWLSDALEETGQKQAGWRTDPAVAGAGGSTGDIGTHAYNLARFVTGLELEALAAELSTFVGGRRLDDNAHVMLRFRGGARGALWCSQVAPGCENALRLRVFGTRARSTGSRRCRPSCAMRRWASRCGGSRAEGRALARRRRASRASRRGTPRATWRGSPTFIPRRPRRSWRGARGAPSPRA